MANITQDRWDEAPETWERRQQLCIGYKVEYIQPKGPWEVQVLAVQDGRTPTVLGTLRMQRDEWNVFHAHVYHRWEDIQMPE